MARVVILGGGFGGLAAAHALLPALASGHTITLVDRRDRFLMGLAKLWVLVGERSPDEGWGDLVRIERKGVRFVREEIAAIDLARRVVRTGGGEHAYDALIIALGAEVAPDAVPGLPPEANLYDAARVPALRDQLARVARGTVALAVCGAPYKCPPAPFEAALLVDTLLRRRGVRDAVSIEVSIPDAEPMPVAGPHAGRAVRALLAERRIALRSSSPVASVDAAARAVVFASGDRFAYEVLLAVPPHRAPRVVRDAGLTDGTGWIPVDPATLATAHPNVFAIGDVAAVKLPGPGLLPKAGIMAERHGEVVGANLLASLAGRAPERRFDGAGYCFFEVGERRAMQVDGTFFADPENRTRFTEPSAEGFEAKQRFERERLERWFG